MTPETFDTTAKIVQLGIELLVSSGAAAALVAYLKGKGVDLQKTQNNKLVQAAENAAWPAILDLTVKGKSITDPSVLSDVTLALKTSLLTTHDGTAAGAGASAADVERIASNAIGKTVLAVTGAAAIPAPANDVTNTIAQAAKVITDAQAAIASVAPPALPVAA